VQRAVRAGPPWAVTGAGVTGSRRKRVRAGGAALSVDCSGEPAPAAEVCRHFGLTVDDLVATVQADLPQKKPS